MQCSEVLCTQGSEKEVGPYDRLVAITRYQVDLHGIISHVEALCWALSTQQELYLQTWESTGFICILAEILPEQRQQLTPHTGVITRSPRKWPHLAKRSSR